MKIKRILCAFACVLMTSLLVASAAVAQQPAAGGRPALDPATLTREQIAQTQVPEALFRLATLYKQSGDSERLEWTLLRLIALRPNSGDLKLALATNYALQGQSSKAYELLLALQKEGFGYDLSNNANFDKIANTKVWKYIVDGLKQNLQPFGKGKVAFALPRGDHLYESLAFDPKRKQLLVGSVRDGTVSLVGKDGKLQEFIKPDAANGLWAVYALAADPASDTLYVASNASVYFKGFTQADFGKAGVFKFSLSTGKPTGKYLLSPDSKPRTLSSIAVGKDGLLFAADGVRNQIYRLDGEALKLMIENPKLTSIRGLALSGDAKTLYFADYTLGVFGVDLAAGQGFEFGYDTARLTLAGVDGLYWYDNNLVVIENGITPHRVMRLGLSDDGRKIVKAMPLDSGNAAFALPTYGAIDGDGLYFIANSQKNEYDSYGTPKDAAKLQAVQVFRSDLRFAWEEPGIDMRDRKPGPQIPPLLAAPKPSGLFGNVEGGAQSASAN
ncbi:MAG: hypothetical protein ABW187_09090 [Dokdonella sp.]